MANLYLIFTEIPRNFGKILRNLNYCRVETTFVCLPLTMACHSRQFILKFKISRLRFVGRGRITDER